MFEHQEEPVAPLEGGVQADDVGVGQTLVDLNFPLERETFFGLGLGEVYLVSLPA
jgi:hypothetical protein